ncbi:hypothetical protein VNO78_20629 [Psophocarpus tetragonolobus]|uniref:non-specific serine/threonine protein kinase n=1 Tax=Psophocarpus tetragonolobus TaxID=3891 RepID=A0AAN9XHB9_PSOTE
MFGRLCCVDSGVAPASELRDANASLVAVERLPDEMNGMKIRDERQMEAIVVDGNGTETGHIIVTTIGGKNGQPKQTISYMAEQIVGNGSFGVVFQAKCLETGETVAIKKVLQDKRYKNRELQTMRLLDHPNVICRALAYIHNCIGVSHRDIKPQNLLVNPHTHQLKICDFGSAKVLVKGEPNISYICSRYYRAPELIFGATEYTTAIDIWSAGCVLGELLLGQIFRKGLPPEAVDLVSRLLQYSPNLRCSVLEALVHPFFDELRDPNTRLPNGRYLPPLFNFRANELKGVPPEILVKLIPSHARKQCVLFAS